MAKLAINTDQTSANVAHLLVRLSLILAFIITPVVLLVSQRAIFVLSSVALALVLAAGPLLAERMRMKAAFAFLISPVGIVCMFLTVWASTSLLWTPFPGEATPRLLKIVSTFLCVLPVAHVLPARSRAANLYVLPIGVAVASVGASVLSASLSTKMLDPATMRTLLDAMTFVLLLLWPAVMAAFLRGRIKLAASLAIIAVIASLSVHSTSALVATAAAALAFLLSRRDTLKTSLWIGRVGAAAFILAPLAPLLIAPLVGAFNGFSWLKVWNGIIFTDGVRLLTGHGFNYVASGYVHGYLGAETPKSLLFEIWTDLGVLGALSSAALLFLAYRLAAVQTANTAPYWIGALTFVATLGFLGGATLQLWWITALALGLVALVLATRGDFQTERPTAPSQSAS
ncbi:hypothetical protein M2323_003595 [Rhodoblastus acidophilus]|uniref:hypothetical protein n=1 Tax=Rhodoblastus acidophilus TaxID=1074 RepID=UPI0022256EDB|nr:hypothetical protein [Rhodoblastus acidophilus]MCW2284222.1 hypothetical protein [Rhodoblastus acidophilus]MCW2334653.1 hypothetical protein [Rhodoblastus acidophilus]